ncbi:hypothetical protein [Orientia tsutsugamushi]|uniref:Conjugative transfer domain protein n=1 Tax=Orientia tsutsugamushi str. TA716 TaxID=1359175 RepID=A0A0F3NR21_ORITS|nr:hypothetical protein [Orientia tsutsugamushi]KJV70540.1 conjugative transfer domain protein [Orientia tsutsugamushi str. TA716]
MLFALFAVAYQLSDTIANSLNDDIGAKINDYGTRGHIFPIIEESFWRYSMNVGNRNIIC